MPRNKNFYKNERRYYCIYYFQDTFNLWELDEVKRQIIKLKKYHMEIFSAVCEVKKVSHSEDNFLEREVHYKLRDNEVKTFLSEMKDFYFYFKLFYYNVDLCRFFNF